MEYEQKTDEEKSFWADIIPDFGCICIDKKRKTNPPQSETLLDGVLLSPQPRSLASSEFSEIKSFDAGENKLWLDEDDIKLHELVLKNNYDWKLISKAMPKFSIANIQERWEFLSKKISKFSSWKKEEDELILRLYNTYNGNWKKISEFVKGRTVAALKNRFYGVLKNKNNGSKSSRDTITSELKDSGISADTLDEKKLVIGTNNPGAISVDLNQNFSSEQKRMKISELYNQMIILQTKIKNTKEKIGKIKCKGSNE